MHQAIFEQLRDAARNRRLITYSELARAIGLDWRKNYGRCRQIFSILGAVSTSEVNQGHPMLSAIAVRQDTMMPGEGFFNLARDLGRHQGRDNYSFWIAERDAVWNTWPSRIQN